jgi:ribosomal protein S18 acetylase RimI-like enzyme
MLLRRYQTQDNQAIKELHYAGIVQMAEAEPPILHPDDPFIDADIDDIENHYLNNGGDFLVGTENGEIVAMGAIRPFSDGCAEVKRLRIRRDCQRRGYARAVMLRLAERAAELGYAEMVLDTLVSNLPAQALFQKCGFIEVDRISHGPFKLIIYKKKLNDGGE